MKWSTAYVILIFLAQPGPQLLFGELISTSVAVGAAVAASSLLSGYQYFKCKWYECCDDRWIKANFTGLKLALQKQIYGQHLVIDNVVRALKAHIENKEPTKALVLSFHGWTGGGKNYVSQIIADHLYVKGVSSQYVHLYLSSLHFPHVQYKEDYQKMLQNAIKGNVTRCGRSLFIFDELDKLMPDVLNSIKPFIDHNRNIDGVDYRKSIFIFLSNTGGNDITQKTLDFWRKGKQRTEIKLNDMEGTIHTAAFNEDGGLRYSELLKNHLIDHFLPFLPMERSHVKLCIRDYFRSKGVDTPSDEAIDKVADTLQYYPSKDIGVFSTSGCKRVAQKVDLYLEEEREKSLSDFDDDDNNNDDNMEVFDLKKTKSQKVDL